jgi:hypothetical protein
LPEGLMLTSLLMVMHGLSSLINHNCCLLPNAKHPTIGTNKEEC